MMSETRRKQEGFVLVVVAVLLVVLIGFVALGVDVGVLYSARSSAQRVADAAALAGAFTFINNPLAPQPDTAIEHAVQVAVNNSIFGEPIVADDVTVSVDVPNRRVTVDVQSSQNTFFASVLVPGDVDISVQAIAESAEDSTAAWCIKPWFIPNTIFAADGACPACEAGEVLISNGDKTSFATSKLGQLFALKPQNPSGSIAPGQFYAVQMPGSVGAADYRANIGTCPAGSVQCNSLYSVETGNMVGPTRQGVNDLIGNPPEDSFVNVGEYLRSDGTLSDTSDALIIAPIWDSCNMPGFCPAGNFGNGTNVQIPVVGFALLFLEGIQGNDVMARLINVFSCAPGGGMGGEEGGSVYSLPLRLVRLPE